MVAQRIEIDATQALAAINSLAGDLPRRFLQTAALEKAKIVRQRILTPNRYFNDQRGVLRGTTKARRTPLRRTTADPDGESVLTAQLTFGGPGARQANIIELGSFKLKARRPVSRAVFDTLTLQTQAAEQSFIKQITSFLRSARRGKVTRVNARTAAGL